MNLKGWKKLNLYPQNSSFFIKGVREDDNEFHICPRPYDLLKTLILNSSNEGDVLLDSFGGSGEHLISALKLKRKFIGFEISKFFCEKIDERIRNRLREGNIITDYGLL